MRSWLNPLIVRFVQGFDGLCFLLGIGALVVLAPTLLILSARASGPGSGQLIRIEGALASCHSVQTGAVFTLLGQPGAYRTTIGPPETCEDELSAQANGTQVAVFVDESDYRRSGPQSITATYGMTVNGIVLRSAKEDVRIGYLDALVFLTLGVASAGTLIVLGRRIRRAPGSIYGLISGRPVSRKRLDLI
jgi:hypothetical protein